MGSKQSKGFQIPFSLATWTDVKQRNNLLRFILDDAWTCWVHEILPTFKIETSMPSRIVVTTTILDGIDVSI